MTKPTVSKHCEVQKGEHFALWH